MEPIESMESMESMESLEMEGRGFLSDLFGGNDTIEALGELTKKASSLAKLAFEKANFALDESAASGKMQGLAEEYLGKDLVEQGTAFAKSLKEKATMAKDLASKALDVGLKKLKGSDDHDEDDKKKPQEED
jgi:hypothetical protein